PPTSTHRRGRRGMTNRETTPSGAQKPPLSQVEPPRTPSTTAATPAANSAFEISLARQSPNAPDMISIARGNALNTTRAHEKSFSADVNVLVLEPAMEYATPALIAMTRKDTAPNAALAAVAAV